MLRGNCFRTCEVCRASWIRLPILFHEARSDTPDVGVFFLRPGAAELSGHERSFCLARRGRAIRTWMLILSGRTRAASPDMDVPFVRPGAAG